jgi:hypothetical protein
MTAPTIFSYLFSGEYRDGLFHFFVDDEHGERELSKENFWKWVRYFGLHFLGDSEKE